MSGQRRLGGHAASERREYLRQYVLACLKDSLLSPADLLQPGTLAEKLLRIISSDTRVMWKDFVQQAKGSALGAVGSALSKLAGDVTGRK